jgi:hypothetical protein
LRFCECKLSPRYKLQLYIVIAKKLCHELEGETKFQQLKIRRRGEHVICCTTIEKGFPHWKVLPSSPFRGLCRCHSPGSESSKNEVPVLTVRRRPPIGAGNQALMLAHAAHFCCPLEWYQIKNQRSHACLHHHNIHLNLSSTNTLLSICLHAKESISIDLLNLLRMMFHCMMRVSSGALTWSMGCGGGCGCRVALSSRPWSNIACTCDIAGTSIGARLG